LGADSGTGDGWQIDQIAAEQFRTLSNKKWPTKPLPAMTAARFGSIRNKALLQVIGDCASGRRL
jgi:hypothetical protein